MDIAIAIAVSLIVGFGLGCIFSLLFQTSIIDKIGWDISDKLLARIKQDEEHETLKGGTLRSEPIDGLTHTDQLSGPPYYGRMPH